MKITFPQFGYRAALVGLALAASVGATQATEHVVSSFATAASTNGWSFQNWDQSTGSVSWTSDDADGSGSSGALVMSTTFSTTNKGGAYRFSVNDFNGTGYTSLEYDYKVDAGSALDTNGTAADFKVGVFTTGAYNYHGNDFDATVTVTNNGWRHVVLDAGVTGGTEWGDIKEVFIQWYDANYTNTTPVTAIVYIDNIKLSGPNPTYPDYTAFTFDNTNFLGGVFTNWYGNPVAVLWSTNDATGDVNSGSAEIVATFADAGGGQGQNNIIMGMWFDTNGTYLNPETNTINGTHYSALELDIKWDTNLSTVALSNFNAMGDISGCPIGLMEGPTTGNNGFEAMGGTTTSIPDEASNGWVHISLPINDATAGIQDTVGLYFKKYNFGGSGVSGTVAFYIDNVKFIGGPIAIAQPTLTLTQPKKGLHIVNNAGGPYDRENLETFDTSFSFVDANPPVTYSINIAEFPSTNYPTYAARIYLTSNGSATEAEPDYVEANVIMIDINRNSDNSGSTTVRCKTNSPGGNGNLYDANQPTFRASTVVGNWSYTFTNNTIIHVVAPDGTSTNLSMPLGLTSSDVQNFFGGGAMVAYFGGYNNGSGNVGQRVVLSGVSIKQGETPLLVDDFTADTSLDINTGGGSGAPWVYASDAATPANAIFLLPADLKYFLDWTIPADGFVVLTNSSLTNPDGWGTNALTATQLGDHFHANVSTNDLPPSGDLFFRLKH